MAYIGSSPTKVVSRQSANIFTYQATANQTAFTGADTNGNTLACSPSDLMVHMNGIKLEESDYTATTTTVTLGSGAAAGDEVTITAFLTFESADHYTKSAADTRYVNASGDTMTGNLGIGGSAKSYLAAYNALDMHSGRTGLMSSTGTPQTNLQTNAYYDSTNSQYEYSISSHEASLYRQQAGTHQFFTAPSGTADAAITFTERMKIDSSGRVTTPNQPFFSCQLNSQTALSGGTVKLNSWISLSSNGGLGSDFANSRFTAPIAGKYLFNYSGLHNTGAVSGGYSRAYTYVNGATVIDGLGDDDTEGSYQRIAYSTILDLSANDYVEIYCNASNSNAFVYNYYTTWSGYLLG